MSGLPRLRDVSDWQGPVDWRAEKRRVAGVYVKVSQGMAFSDRRGLARIANGTSAGMWRLGGYHYCVPGSGSGESQAERLIQLAPLAPGRLRPCLDCEDNTLGLNPGQLAAWYLGAVTHLHSRLGYWPTLYGSPGYLQSFATMHPSVFGHCPLWIAHYGVKRPTIPAPWSHWAAWQWTPAASDPAVPGGKVDDSFVADLAAITVPANAKRLWLRPRRHR